MANKFLQDNPQVAIANDLKSGLTCYFDSDTGQWQSDINAATIAYDNIEKESLLKQAKADELHNIVIGVDMIAIDKKDNYITPLHIREWIRYHGPTILYKGNHHVSL